MLGALLVLILGMLIPKRFPLGPIETLLKVEHKGIISKEVVAMEVMESIVVRHMHHASSQIT